jgi:hypothetical protein
MPAGETNTSADEAIHAPDADLHATQRIEDGQSVSPQGERSNERRERRGRERPGRERQARAGQSDDGIASHASDTGHAPVAQEHAHTPVAATTTVASTSTAMPKVSTFDLPMEQLQQVAQSSGLEWINSNPERIGTLNKSLIELTDAGVLCASFREPDLGDQLTAFVFIVDDRAFDRETWPDYDGLWYSSGQPEATAYWHWKMKFAETDHFFEIT